MAEITVIEGRRDTVSRHPVAEAAAAATTHMPDKLRVAAYCRVSTEQEEQLGSFANQVKTYREKISSNPDWEFAGIYADEGVSGTRAEKRPGFQKMMSDAREGLFDQILTKSISRFARNVIDSLKYTRELKGLGIAVEFEEEHLVSTDPSAEMIFTILSAVAEQESRNISEHTKWGIRSAFRRGEYRNIAGSLYGFRKDETGKIVIREDQADIVRLIYQSYLDGMSYYDIAGMLNEMGIPAKSKGSRWQNSTIRSILTNENYKGDVILQKTYVRDFISHKPVPNTGELDQYFIADAHPAIVDKDTWEAVCLEMERRATILDSAGNIVQRKSGNPYSGKIYMKNACHALLTKHTYGSKTKGTQGGTWKCRFYRNSYHRVCHDPARIIGLSPDSLPPCSCFPINHKIVRRFFIEAWNSMINTNLPQRRQTWTDVTDDKGTDPLSRVRARQMLDLSSDSRRITEDVPELVRMVLERIDIADPRHAEVHFLDGTTQNVTLPSEFEWEQ